jgi:predicted amidohydrolase
MFEEKIWDIKDKPDLILLPEMFTTGFSMNASALAEPLNLTTFKWMKQQAEQTGAVIAGSVIIKEGGNYFNRLLWMTPEGKFSYYDKRHLFRMAGEEKIYSSGSAKTVLEIKGWKILPMICYDLRFPVWSRNVNNAFDLLIYVANWPAPRRHAWITLLKARAIENLSYVAGLNRVGEDGKGLHYSGDSAVIDFKGEELYSFGEKEHHETITLSYKALKEFREKFPAYLDADNFSITP